MRKFIHADKAMKEKLKKIFKCSDKTIRNALAYNHDKGNSDLCKKIRFTAVKNGCLTYEVVGAFECFHDADGIMWQLFANGAQVSLNKKTGYGEITFKGDIVAKYEHVQLTDISSIQEKAASF